MDGAGWALDDSDGQLWAPGAPESLRVRRFLNLSSFQITEAAVVFLRKQRQPRQFDAVIFGSRQHCDFQTPPFLPKNAEKRRTTPRPFSKISENLRFSPKIERNLCTFPKALKMTPDPPNDFLGDFSGFAPCCKRFSDFLKSAQPFGWLSKRIFSP